MIEVHHGGTEVPARASPATQGREAASDEKACRADKVLQDSNTERGWAASEVRGEKGEGRREKGGDRRQETGVRSQESEVRSER